MASTVLSLPIDVTWKRLAISQDMYATSIAADFPEKWRSSIAVYYFEPEPDPTDDTGEVTTFLKLVVSITGYNYDSWFVGVAGVGGPISVSVFTTYFPALSALAQIGVFPSDGQWGLDEYPYFIDFEPKRREVLETRTETGEFVNHTTEPLNVKKSTTTTDSQEVHAAYNNPSGGPSGPQVTSRIGTASETLFTDASREKRESTSYTTNVTQLYQLLTSYHSGTNRALFLTAARPHLVDSIYTFVNGPRRLEGIQDFFLVVRRPRAMNGICVKAVLETAHLDLTGLSLAALINPLTFFTTARAVSGCTGPGGPRILPSGPWVVYEKELNQTVAELVKASQQSGSAAVVAANAVSRQVNDMLVASFREGLRYPLGQVDFLHTNMVMRQVLAGLKADVLQDRPDVLAAAKKVEDTMSKSSPLLSSTDLAARKDLLRAIGVHPAGDTATTDRYDGSQQEKP